MESIKFLSLAILLAFLLLVKAVAEVTGDELRTFVVLVQPHENQDLGTAADRTAWYKSFLPDDGRLVHAYHHAASGFAARLTLQELDAVAAMPGFVGAVEDQTYTLQTTHTPQFLGLSSQQGAWNNSTSERGAGVIIGVLDTGIFPDHPSFSGAGMPPPPAKWKGRCDFNGGGVQQQAHRRARFHFQQRHERRFFRRQAGATGGRRWARHSHGKHGGGSGRARCSSSWPGHGGRRRDGAPRSRCHVQAYKVCPGTTCPRADVLAGVDAAIADGCDIISMSIGKRGHSMLFHNDTFAIGTLAAIEKGVFVSMAAGNNGPYARSVSNEAPWMLTVAASTMDRSIRTTVRLGNGQYFHGQSAYQPNVSAAVFYPLVYAGASGKPLAELCVDGSLDDLDVKGKIVLCEDGLIGSVEKGSAVQSAGGVGMVLMNLFSEGHITFAEAHVLPVSHVDYAAGVAINLQNPGILKPDVTGPGVNVLAAWPFQVGRPPASAPHGPTFNIISGTSMSTPHLSGIAAFIKSKHPDWSPAAIKSAIMTTADIDDRSGNRILDEHYLPTNFFAIGAGHVNPEKAVNPGLVYDTDPSDYVGFLCGMYTSQQVSVVARRQVNCSAITAIPGHQLNYPSISVTFPAASNSTTPVIVKRTVKNVGEVPSSYYAAVDMPEGAVDVSPTRLEFSEDNQEQSFLVLVRPTQSDAGVVQGALRWVSETRTVRSPISIGIAKKHSRVSSLTVTRFSVHPMHFDIRV
ncbi:hypothetical protein ACP70R_011168 [Stipagrostis hirtigluma subsp. patula]